MIPLLMSVARAAREHGADEHRRAEFFEHALRPKFFRLRRDLVEIHDDVASFDVINQIDFRRSHCNMHF